MKLGGVKTAGVFLVGAAVGLVLTPAALMLAAIALPVALPIFVGVNMARDYANPDRIDGW